MENRLVESKQELIESSLRFIELRNSPDPEARKFFAGRMKNIDRFVALARPDGYIFAPGAYVAYHGATTLEDWKAMMLKPYRQTGRDKMDSLLGGSIAQGHPRYDELEQAFRGFLGGIEFGVGKSPLFWLLEDGGLASSVGEEWTDKELNAAVSTYLEMLSLERQNKPYSKKSFNEALRLSELKNRTASSVEFRMQNISAVLEELCLPRIRGYMPAKNVGRRTKDKIKEMLETQGYVSAETYSPANDPDELDRKVDSIRKRFVPGLPKGNPSPTRFSRTSEVFERDPLVKASVLETAGNTCECCGSKAPFLCSDGFPYLEVHHVRTLADKGSDTVSNAVAICPNCHRALHYAPDRRDRVAALYKKVKRLIPE